MARGKFKLSSSPSGFRVWINGVQKAYSTPHTVGLPTGDYEFTFKKAGYEDHSFFHTLKADETYNISFTGVSTAPPPPPPPPEPPPPPPPPPPKEGSIRVISKPSGADILLDGNPTGKQTTAVITTTTGQHKITLLLDRHVQFDTFIEILPSQSFQRTYTLEPIERPPEPPPEEDLEAQFDRPLEALARALTGEVPQWLTEYENVLDWITEHFGTELPTLYKDKITGEFKKAPTGKKIVFLVSMKAPVVVGQEILKKALVNMTATEIRALAAADPNKLRALWQGLDKPTRLGIYNLLQTPGVPREAFKAVFRVVQEPVKKLVIPTWLKVLTAAGTVATIWVGFQLVDFVFGLRKQKVLPPFQSEELKEISFAANDIVGLLETTKFSCDKEAFNKILEEIPALNDKWDKLILYAQENLLTADQVADFIDNALAYVGILPPRTSDALLATITGAKHTFNLQVETEVAAIRTKCAWTEEEAEAKLYGTVVLKTEPADTLVRVAGEEKAHTTGQELKLIAGSHDIVVEAEGFQSRRKTVISKAGETTTVSFILEEIPEEIEARAGRLQILVYNDQTGAPITATLIVDGRVEQFPGHQHVLDMKPDTYEIRVEKAGFDFYTDTISIDEGKTTALVVRLKAPPAIEPPLEPELPEEVVPEEIEKGRLEVNANVKASIALGGVDTGETTPHLFALTQGLYTVKLSAEGYTTRFTTTLVKAGEPTTVSLELFEEEEPAVKVRLAKISLQSEPVGCKILVNGDFTRKYTPDSIWLNPGDYEITLTKSGFKPWTAPLRLVEET